MDTNTDHITAVRACACGVKQRETKKRKVNTQKKRKGKMLSKEGMVMPGLFFIATINLSEVKWDAMHFL